jgi:hypothetical protein
MLDFDLDVKKIKEPAFFVSTTTKNLFLGCVSDSYFIILCTNKVATFCNSVGNDSDHFCFLYMRHKMCKIEHNQSCFDKLFYNHFFFAIISINPVTYQDYNNYLYPRSAKSNSYFKCSTKFFVINIVKREVRRFVSFENKCTVLLFLLT